VVICDAEQVTAFCGGALAGTQPPYFSLNVDVMAIYP